MKQTRLFGTDGIRGIAGEYPLDQHHVSLIGRALGQFLQRSRSGLAAPSPEPRVLIGEDTRESSRWIAETLAAGLAQEEVVAVSAGVIPTAGIAYLSRRDDFAAGLMISASHNPYRDNGIKVFVHSGYKLPDEGELEVEENIFRLAPGPVQAPAALRLVEDATLRARYEDFLCSLVPPGTDFKKLRIVVDCANGAASAIAPELFRRLGAAVVALHASPDGRNINLGCGSLDTAGLQARVPAEAADLGVAFDGDADRALFATARGSLVDGDGVLYLAARHMLAEGRLAGRLVVGTVMANLGLELALGSLGLRLVRTPVGDKYVLEEMLRSGANLGGEQSGHIIFSDHHTTGDGLLTALQVMQIMVRTGSPLDELVSDLKVCPQVLRNVPVREKVPIERLPEVAAAIRASQEYFGHKGRVVVRYSGTEPLARIMVEAPDEAEVRSHAETIAAAFQRALGA